MIILNEDNKAIILEDIITPLTCDYFWVLDMTIMDFTLTPITSLEEIISPAIELSINGVQIWVPAMWNILLVDDETSQLDFTEVSELAGTGFNAFVYGHNLSMVEPTPISVTNYTSQQINVNPSIHKHQLMCHPIGFNRWICLAPSDSYNKFLKNAVLGDIV